MFGGLAFLIGGHMAVAVSGQGGLMLRCDPGETEALLAEPGATPMVMRGKEMRGWLRVEETRSTRTTRCGRGSSAGRRTRGRCRLRDRRRRRENLEGLLDDPRHGQRA